jgi:hypothetical protein
LGSRAEGLQHILQVADNKHDEAVYIFGILMIEYNNSLVEVEEALLHVDKFSMSSLSDRTIREWICSVHWKTVIMLKRYEELSWGHRFFADTQDLPQCCDRTTSKMRGFVSQDHIGGFSTKRECANTHK